MVKMKTNTKYFQDFPGPQLYHLQGIDLLHFSLILVPLIDFSSLTVLSSASSTMLTSIGPLWFIADLTGNVPSISPLSKILALGTKYIFYDTKQILTNSFYGEFY